MFSFKARNMSTANWVFAVLSCSMVKAATQNRGPKLLTAHTSKLGKCISVSSSACTNRHETCTLSLYIFKRAVCTNAGLGVTGHGRSSDTAYGPEYPKGSDLADRSAWRGVHTGPFLNLGAQTFLCSFGIRLSFLWAMNPLPIFTWNKNVSIRKL